MYSEKYLRLTKQLLKFEGGKVDNPNDRGGRTAYGVTQRTYDAYRKLRESSLQDVFSISQEEVLEIYFRSYYLPMHLELIDSLPSSYIIYDFAVNSGVRSALNLKCNMLIPETANPNYLLNQRENYYHYICKLRPKNNFFLKGWLNRLIKISDIYQLNWVPKNATIPS